MYYGDQRASLVVIMEGLIHRGWLIYGYKEDKSDAMVDYFDPARWDGIAVKNGYILVVDNQYRCGKIGGSAIHKSYDAKIQKKLQKLYALRDNHAASEGEKANAQSIINSLSQKVVSEIVMESGLPEVTYQKNPQNAKWHIERDGKIIDKGTGVYGFYSMQYHLSKETCSYPKLSDNDWDVKDRFDSEEEWTKHYDYILKERKEQIKLLDKYDALLNKWDSLVVLKLGDGDEDALVQKTVKKESFYYVAEESDVPTDYVRLGKRWSSYHGLESERVYKVKDGKYFKLTPQWITLNDGKGIQAFKPEPNKSTRQTSAWIGENDFVEKHVIYVNLVQKVEIMEQVVWVRQSKLKATKQAKKDAAPVKKETVVIPNDNKFSKLIENGRVKDFEHTRTGEMLKVLVITEDLGKEGFMEFNKYMIKSGKGYYSRPAQGWILKDKSAA